MSPEEVMQVFLDGYQKVKDKSVNIDADPFWFREQFFVNEILNKLGVDLESFRKPKTFLLDEKGLYHVDDTAAVIAFPFMSDSLCSQRFKTRKVTTVLKPGDTLCQNCSSMASMADPNDLQEDMSEAIRQVLMILHAVALTKTDQNVEHVFSFEKDTNRARSIDDLLSNVITDYQNAPQKVLPPQVFESYQKAWLDFVLNLHEENMQRRASWGSTIFKEQLVQELSEQLKGKPLSTLVGPQVFLLNTFNTGEAIMQVIVVAGETVYKDFSQVPHTYVVVPERLANLFYTYVKHQQIVHADNVFRWYLEEPIPASNTELVEIACKLHEPLGPWDINKETKMRPLNTLQGAHQIAVLASQQ